jgi:hypothetical protein
MRLVLFTFLACLERFEDGTAMPVLHQALDTQRLCKLDVGRWCEDLLHRNVFKGRSAEGSARRQRSINLYRCQNFVGKVRAATTVAAIASSAKALNCLSLLSSLRVARSPHRSCKLLDCGGLR